MEDDYGRVEQATAAPGEKRNVEAPGETVALTGIEEALAAVEALRKTLVDLVAEFGGEPADGE